MTYQKAIINCNLAVTRVLVLKAVSKVCDWHVEVSVDLQLLFYYYPHHCFVLNLFSSANWHGIGYVIN